jgi:hypothetical protein
MGLDITGLGAIADTATTIINKIWPDKTEQEKMEIAGFFALMQGQLDINKVEAGNSSIFVAGWRPAAGWVCVTTLALTFIPKAVILAFMWAMQAWVVLHTEGGVLPPYPDVGLTDVLGLLAALLGIGGMRSFDKMQGTAS